MVGGGVGLTNQSKSTCAVPQASHASQLRSVEAVPFPLYSLLSINTIVTNTRTLLEYLSDKEPIPAHLFGNMWAQSWGNLFSRIQPYRR